MFLLVLEVNDIRTSQWRQNKEVWSDEWTWKSGESFHFVQNNSQNFISGLFYSGSVNSYNVAVWKGNRLFPHLLVSAVFALNLILAKNQTKKKKKLASKFPCYDKHNVALSPISLEEEMRLLKEFLCCNRKGKGFRAADVRSCSCSADVSGAVESVSQQFVVTDHKIRENMTFFYWELSGKTTNPKDKVNLYAFCSHKSQRQLFDPISKYFTRISNCCLSSCLKT